MEEDGDGVKSDNPTKAFTKTCSRTWLRVADPDEIYNLTETKTIMGEARMIGTNRESKSPMLPKYQVDDF